MRRLLLAVVTLAACGREPEPPVPPAPPPPKPIVNRAPLPAPLERIAFAREDGIWTMSADGGDLERIVPPTCPRASEPSWAPDRRWIAFTAELAPDSNLFPRNVFVARPDGSELRQVTPLPKAGVSADDLPKGIVRGRAVFVTDDSRRPVPRLRVTAAGLRREELTDPEGNFQTYLPVGGGWVKLSGQLDGRPVLGWRFAAAAEGRITELKDVAIAFGTDDVPSSPAWSADGKQLLYVLRHPLEDHKAGTPRSTLRRIRVDGSGDETVAAFTRASILAGPVVRGDSAWCKLSDGTIVRIDLKLKIVTETRPAGISAPDALAVSPDAAVVATLAMDAAGARTVVLIRKDSTQTLALRGAELAPQAVDFSPDGARLVLQMSGPDGRSSLWIHTIADGQLARLVDLGSGPVWHGR